MNLYKFLLRLILAAALTLPAAAAEAGKGEALGLHEKLDTLIPHGSRWALTVTDLATGKEMASIGSARDEPLIPGSVIKLVTAGALFDGTATQGGLDMKTAILHDGAIEGGTLKGNIYLRGGGNALLTASDLKKAAEKISRAGIRRIPGSIIADDTLFDTKGMERSRKGAGHAPVGALGVDLHTVAVTVTPTEPGKPPGVTVDPPNDAVRLAISARTTAGASSTVRITQLDDTSYRVDGDIPAGTGPVKQRFPLAEPARYAVGTLMAELKQAGVKVEGHAGKGKAPGDAKLLAEIGAPRLDGLIRVMNVNSINVLADNLLLLLGAKRFGAPGTRENGVKAIGEFLSSLDLPAGEAVIADGSGLLDDNRVTTRFMAAYLHKIASRSWFAGFRDSLPRPGMEGTVREIGFRDERFRVKTGRLENAFAVAGYGVDGRGRDMAFAFIVNVPGAGALNLEYCGAEVMRYLATEGIQ